MLELFIIAGAIIMFRRQLGTLTVVAPVAAAAAGSLAPRQVSPQLSRMIEYADRLYAEKKWLAAEKAYLGVLKLDHKNTTAYTHLGIIYSTQKNTADAVECFEIAARLRPTGSTYQNLGLAYLENRNYMKAIATLDKSIMLESSAPRYLSLARAYRKIGDTQHAITALEKAAELEPSHRTLTPLAEAYHAAGKGAEAMAAHKQLRELSS